MLKITAQSYPGRNYGLVVTIDSATTELVFDSCTQANDVERLLREAYRAGKGAPDGTTLWEDVPRGSVWQDTDGNVGVRWLHPDAEGNDCSYGRTPVVSHSARQTYATPAVILAQGLTQKQCDWVAEVCEDDNEMRKRARFLVE